jgi:hypothetical protein
MLVNPEALLSPGAAARQLGVSYERVRQLDAEGRLRVFHTAMGRLIDPRSVEQYASERVVRRRTPVGAA